MPAIWLAPAECWAPEHEHEPCSHSGSDCSDDEPCSCSRPCCMDRGRRRSRPPSNACNSHASLSLHPDHDPDVAGRTVLVVLPGGPGRRRLLRSMRAAGARVLCYATDRCPALAQHLDDHAWILGPSDDVEGALAAIDTWLHGCDTDEISAMGYRRRIDSLMCYNEFGLELYAQLAKAMCVPPRTTLPLWLVEAARSKRVFRRACVAAGIPAPRFAHLTAPATPDHPEQLEALAAAGVRLPVIVKPSGCAGSFSVLRVDTPEELAKASQGFWDRLPAYLRSSKLGASSLAATDGLLVEELIQGQEVDVDCVVYQGQLLFAAVSDNHPCKTVDGVSAFVETGGCCPSLLPDEAQEQILDLAARVVDLFGPELSGVLHFEAMYSSSRQMAVPIEVNARIGGGETYTNVLTAWGIDLAQAALRIACGLRPRLPPSLRGQSERMARMPSALGGTTAGVLRVLSGDNLATGAEPTSLLGMPPHAWAQISAFLPRPACCGGSCSCLDCVSSWGRMVCPDGCPWALWALLDSAPKAACLCRNVPSLLCNCGCQDGCTAGGQQGGPGSGEHLVTVELVQQHGEEQGDGHAREHADEHARDHAGDHKAEHASDDGGSGLFQVEVTAPSAKQGSGPLQSKAAMLTRGESVLDDHHSCSGDEDCSQCSVRRKSRADVDAPHAPLAVGRLLRAAPQCSVYSVNFVPEWTGAGVIERFDVSPGALQDAALVDVEVYVGPGDLVLLPPAGFSALGWIVAKAEGPEEARCAMDRLLEGVMIQLRKPEGGGAAAKNA